MSNEEITQPERILCAALMYRDEIIAGHRHSDCYHTLIFIANVAEKYLPNREAQGFLTSHNRFVSRADAYKIARERNQLLLPHEEGSEEILISENLY